MILHDLFVWIVTGLIAGWLARLAMRSNHDYGITGDLVTGSLGALIGGWLLRRIDAWTPSNLFGHMLVALAGATALLLLLRMLRKLISATGWFSSSALTEGVNSLEAFLRQTTEFDRNLVAKFLKTRPTTQDTNQAFAEQLTIGERVADRIATFGGSWPFIGIFMSVIIVWMVINQDMGKPFDPYPFILLNLILSCLAAIQAPVIMMSQNRQAARDRLEARNNFEVNLRSEIEIMALHQKLDNLQNENFINLVQSIQEQKTRLEIIEKKMNEANQ